jgi:uncharacterized protein
LSLPPGTRLGVYEVTEQIGEGGMGQVFRATDTKLKRKVAIKTLPSSVAADADRLARFQRDADVLASLLTLESMYASLPTVVCKGLCAESCGPIACSQAEADRMEAAAGRPLEFTRGMTCGYLDQVHRRCTVYAVRPMICRLWGVAKDMACPWGCQPTPAPVEPAAVRRLINLTAVIGGDLVVATKGTPHANDLTAKSSSQEADDEIVVNR